ncbi:MAG TPA: hypothetical protein VF458_11360 [Ktedonobacteraceae bacterium]
MATQDMQVLACPKCGAADDDFDSLGQDLSKPIKCKACDAVYTLQQRQDDAQQREQSLRAWVEQKIAGFSASSSTGVDSGTRSYLFRNNFYPDLKRDVDRRLEDLENAPEIPVIPLKPLSGFADYQPNHALVMLGEGNNNEWLKMLSTRLSAQRVLDFATTDEDQRLLKALSFRVNNLIYYANIARFLRNGEHTALHVVQHNVQELEKAYQAFAQEAADQSHRSYLLALTARLSGASLLLDVLIPVLEEGRSFVPEAVFAQLERSARQYQSAEQQANVCTYNPLYVVPLQQGIQKDLMALQVMSTIIKCYEVVLHSRQIEFGAFFDSAMRYVYSLTPIQSFAQLLGLLDSLRRMLAARAGEVPLPVINDWSWLQPAIDANKRKAMFGPPESVGAVERHLHPYWVATLNYAEKQGKIFKSGLERSAFILADATSVNAPIVGYLLTNDPLLPTIEQGTRNFSLLDKEILALPALLSRERAEQMMKQFANLHAAELGATIVKMLDLIYLPVAYVKYNGKNQQREQLLGRMNFVNQNLSQALAQTHQFLRQYGA